MQLHCQSWSLSRSWQFQVNLAVHYALQSLLSGCNLTSFGQAMGLDRVLSRAGHVHVMPFEASFACKLFGALYEGVICALFRKSKQQLIRSPQSIGWMSPFAVKAVSGVNMFQSTL